MFNPPLRDTNLVFSLPTATGLIHISGVMMRCLLCLSMLLASACDADKTDESKEVGRAREALSAALGQPASSFTLISAHAIKWQDSSLGCPKPGMSYMQVIVDGHRVVLSDKQQKYNVHLGPRQAMVCPSNDIPPPDGILPTPER